MKLRDMSKTKKKGLSLSDTEQNTILEATINGDLSIDVARNLQISLMTFYKYLEQNPKFKAEYEKAQEIGVKTLVEKMLKIFDTDPASIEPNELLFLREKKDFLKWLSPRLSSMFQEKQKLDVKQDSTIKISWEENNDNLIDVSADTISDTSDSKDL
jgi:hypothetical protein